jgi:hypothetical protein
MPRANDAIAHEQVQMQQTQASQLTATMSTDTLWSNIDQRRDALNQLKRRAAACSDQVRGWGGGDGDHAHTPHACIVV